ncbi:MAG: AMP-binding protein [Rhodospirillaceae bacterium]|nr:AMP-binding protein [Rhodospirillaceae bacterium]MBT5458102.1 AMP-binding protein [Rhodospirillaceae bacterium]
MPDGSNLTLTRDLLDFSGSLERVAQAQPNAKAILAPGRRPLSFAGLIRQMTDVRETLNSWGIGREDRVAVILTDGPEATVAFLGVTSGAIYIALNPAYTHGEFEAYLTLLRPKAIIVSAAEETPAREVAENLGIPTIELVVEEGDPAGHFVLTGGSHSFCSLPGPSQADDVALLSFTSATTELSKIVPVRHRHWLIAAWDRVRRLEITPEDCALNPMPLFHGHGQFLALSALLGGASLVCPPRFDLIKFFDCLERYPVTFYSASFAIHEAIASQLPNYRHIVRNINLRFFKIGSGRLDRAVVDTLEEEFRAPAIELYSNSEACIVTANPLHSACRKYGSAGLPVLSEVAILANDGTILPPGHDGEIIVRGPCIFDGYIDNPDADAAAFHKDWFRTGDMGHLDMDGYLFITGRIKEIINRGGEKISPLEVDHILQQHPAVQDVATFAYPHSTLGEDVAAAVILRKEGQASEEELICFARESLAHFKVPRRVIFVDELPRTATGKILRKKLSEIFEDVLKSAPKPAQISQIKSTATPLETALTGVWKSVLELDEISPDDDFFLLGGDSLLAATLFAEVSAVFGVELPLKAIFDDAATIEGMAEIIGETRSASTAKAAYKPRSEDVVVMNADGHLPPLFAVGGNGGHSIGFAHVARLLGPEQPFFGLDSVGLDGKEEPLIRIEDIAAEHIRRLQKVQPEGPYYLIGACFGGRVAYEIAQQLTRDDHDVGLTIMLDPSDPLMKQKTDKKISAGGMARLTRSDATKSFVRARLNLYWSELKSLPWGERYQYARDKLGIMKEVATTRDLHRGNPTQLYWDAVFRANKMAGASYSATSYSGPVAVFWCSDRPDDTSKQREDWLSLLGNQLVVSEGTGDTTGTMMLPPHVEPLCEKIRDSLRLAQRR